MESDGATFFDCLNLWAVFWVMQRHKSAELAIFVGRVFCVFALLMGKME